MTTTVPSSPLATLLADHLPLVYAAALRQTRNPHLAEDITQSVFLLAARKLPSIPPHHAGAWLFKVTHHITLTHLRADRRRLRHERRAASEAPLMTTDSPPGDPALNSHLDAALSSLCQSDRELLLRRYFHNHPVADIAAALHLTPNTTTKRLTRALEKLRHRLAKAGLPESSLAALPTSLLATAMQNPPAALTAKILTASTTATFTSIPVGILLMTTTTKTTLALAAFIVLLATIPVISLATRTHRASTAPPPIAPIAAPIPPAHDNANDTGFTTLTGTVKDSAGNPLPNILVTQGDPPQLVRGYFTTHTDADGRFTFHRVQVGLDLTLAVHAPGFSPDLITGTVTSNPPPFAFALKPAHTLRVRLVDIHGNPIPNLELNPWQWRNTFVLQIYPTDKRWTGPISDADGIVTWTDAPADQVLYDHFNANYLSMPFPLTASEQLQTVTIRDPIHVSLRAVDSQTNTPLSHFGVTYGYGDTATNVRYWQDDQSIEPQAVTNGEYQTTINSISHYVPYQFYRISAPGYAPVVHSFDAGQASVSLTYQLSKKDGVLVLIHQPDGVSRAADAAVYTIRSSQNFSLQSSEYFHNGRFAMGGGQALQHADTDGHLFLANPHDRGARIVILHESGFAELTFSDAQKSPITLQPWASVDGTARIGSQPAAHKTVTVDYTTNHGDPPYISGTFTTTTDDDGHFSFPQLPPAHSFIGLYLEANVGTRYAFGTIANPIELTLAPGENHLTLGGTGRLLTGRILNPDHSPLHAGITTEGNLLTRGPHIREITFPIAPDGTFEIPDVAPDTYSFTTTIIDLHNNQPLGTLQKSITVSLSTDPLNLGDIPLTRPPTTDPKG